MIRRPATHIEFSPEEQEDILLIAKEMLAESTNVAGKEPLDSTGLSATTTQDYVSPPGSGDMDLDYED